MREWFDKHGQNSGWHRANHFGITVLKIASDQLDARRQPAFYEGRVFERDSYTCRYCGLMVIAKEVLLAFEKAVGVSEFCTKGKNADQHGVIHAFKPVADHVYPHRLGGRTALDNLVTSCPACNYGKGFYTLDQLGITDPRIREPAQSNWDGLMSLLPGLRENPFALPLSHL